MAIIMSKILMYELKSVRHMDIFIHINSNKNNNQYDVTIVDISL